jgi:hypothetical protein
LAVEIAGESIWVDGTELTFEEALRLWQDLGVARMKIAVYRKGDNGGKG